MGRHIRWLIIIILLSIFCIWVALPDTDGFRIDMDNDGEAEFALNIKQSLGLDLVGGLRVLLQAEIPPDAYTVKDLIETANNVSRRVNALGLTEATVQALGSDRILVELPGVTDREVAIETIQQTALLEFVDFGGLRAQAQSYEDQRILTDAQLETFGANDETLNCEERLCHPTTKKAFETIMTGAGLQSASAVYGATSQAGTPQWYIAFDVKEDSQTAFAEFTGSRVNEPMAIVLDGIVLSAPIINSRLTTGGIITGNFSEKEAQTLALQLRSGALPIPLKIESIAEVGATLGQESIELSVKAGIIGVLVVFTFMLVYYRVPGLAADFALIVFILINMMLFKLIPITLTLPAITGFLISIGTAVDGNILIFERIKEELRDGLEIEKALDAGFDRAWASIRDSNLSTIIICVILFLFGLTPGASIVSGFAVTLGVGLIVNLFTAIIVTRTFLYLLVRLFGKTLETKRWLLGS